MDWAPLALVAHMGDEDARMVAQTEVALVAYQEETLVALVTFQEETLMAQRHLGEDHTGSLEHS